MPPTTVPATYAIAIGSNRRGWHGSPEQEVAAAIAALAATGRVTAVAPIVRSAPVGPSTRRFANTAVLVTATHGPPAMLAALKRIERAFGRRGGRRWGTRVVDLDIVLWSGGVWRTRALTIPHEAFRLRDFVLRPLERIAPEWRDPVTARSIRQLASAVDRRRPLGQGRRIDRGGP